MDKIRIIVADDHTIVRAGIRLVLESMEGVNVVAEAADGRQALELVRNLRPDLLLADIAMPGYSGLDLAQRLTEERLETRVIILSMHNDPEYVRRAIELGSHGYVLKGSGIEELGLAIQAAARGEMFLSPAITGPVVHEHLGNSSSVAGSTAVLTARQREVLRLLAEGGTTKAVAKRLGISAKTVEAHRSQLMERLKIHELAGLVRYAIRTGLIGPDA
jgi:DNA-binding NarL/FixJ family response regulator